MPNLYKSFYLQDLLAVINEVALEAMYETKFDSVDNRENAYIGIYNDGIRDMAKAIAERLNEEAVENE